MNERYKTIYDAKAKNKKTVEIETIYDLPYSITDNVKTKSKYGRPIVGKIV